MDSGGNIGGGTSISGHWWGTFTFRENYQTVTVQNDSSLELVLNQLVVINPTAQPTVTLNAGGTVQTGSPFFKIVQVALPTTVTFTNTSASAMLFKGTIDNPIGTTTVSNTGGDILGFCDGSRSGCLAFIRSNVLSLSAPAGSIGSTSTYLAVDPVQWDGGAMVFTADAAN